MKYKLNETAANKQTSLVSIFLPAKDIHRYTWCLITDNKGNLQRHHSPLSAGAIDGMVCDADPILAGISPRGKADAQQCVVQDVHVGHTRLVSFVVEPNLYNYTKTHTPTCWLSQTFLQAPSTAYLACHQTHTLMLILFITPLGN